MWRKAASRRVLECVGPVADEEMRCAEGGHPRAGGGAVVYGVAPRAPLASCIPDVRSVGRVLEGPDQAEARRRDRDAGVLLRDGRLD
jgi:hypothetical protein